MEEEIQKSVGIITKNSTFLLMLATVLYAITTAFGVMLDPITGTPSVYILGSAALGSKNILYLQGLGGLFGLIQTILIVCMNLFAGLSFAAVCFDENRDIWFRVVSVAALMLILYGGLSIF
ncbi:MAG: hypothetical protein ACTSPV_19910 [Candidatus Hodarchaeales archaeon]